MGNYSTIIKDRRIKAGMSQVTLGEMLGHTNNGGASVSNWENGRGKPNYLNAQALSQILGGTAYEYRMDETAQE